MSCPYEFKGAASLCLHKVACIKADVLLAFYPSLELILFLAAVTRGLWRGCLSVCCDLITTAFTFKLKGTSRRKWRGRVTVQAVLRVSQLLLWAKSAGIEHPWSGFWSVCVCLCLSDSILVFLSNPVSGWGLYCCKAKYQLLVLWCSYFFFFFLFYLSIYLFLISPMCIFSL